MEVIGIILIMGGGVADQGEGTLIDLSDLYPGNPQLGPHWVMIVKSPYRTLMDTLIEPIAVAKSPGRYS